MSTNSNTTFVASGVRYHCTKKDGAAEPNLVRDANGRLVLTATGRQHFARRLDDATGGEGAALVAACHKAMREGADHVTYAGARYALIPFDPKAVRGLQARVKTYLAPQHCSAGGTVSQACFSALFV